MLYDIQFLNSTDEISAFWHGFSDIGSGIDLYQHCVSTPRYQGRCDIYPAKDVGAKTMSNVVLNEKLTQGNAEKISFSFIFKKK